MKIKGKFALAAKLKKESEKARKALCKENEKKRKEKQKLLVVIVKLPPPLPTRMNSTDKYSKSNRNIYFLYTSY